MDDLGALVRRAGKDFHRDLRTPGIEPRINSCGGKRGQLGQPLPPAECLEIFVKHLIGGCLPIGKNDDRIGVFLKLAVLQGETRHDLGTVVRPMAGEARHTWLPAEVGAVDVVHHRNHAARPLDRRGFDGKRITIAADFRRVATTAVIAKGGGKHPHRVHELVHGNPFENLDVLEDDVRHLQALIGSRLAGCCHKAHQEHGHRHHDVTNRSLPSELHVVYLSCVHQKYGVARAVFSVGPTGQPLLVHRLRRPS